MIISLFANIKIRESIAADFHISIDGNFHHRHLRKAGIGFKSGCYRPGYFIEQSAVQAMAQRIKSAKAKTNKRKSKRKSKLKQEHEVPLAALAACKESFKAAHEH